MAFLDFLKPANPTVPPPGTSAHKAYLRATGNTSEQGADAYAAQQAVPPPGTSARKAYDYVQEYGAPHPLSAVLGTDVEPNNPAFKSYRPAANGLTSPSVKQIDYLNADLAEYYGMTKATAYQEALNNTAYQRSVADMKAAGLNPAVLFGSGHGSPAGSSVYASGSGGSGRRYSGSKSSDSKLFSGSAYSAIQAIGGLVGLATTKRPDGFWIGSQTAKGAMGLLDSIWKK